MFEQLNIFDFIEEDLDSIIESKSIHHNIHFGRINYWYSHPTELNKHGELYERDIEKNCFFCGYQFISRDEVKMIMPKIGADYRIGDDRMEELQKRIKLNERVARIFMALAAVCMVLDLLSPGGSWESTIIALGFSCYHHALSETLRVQMMVLNK